MDEMNERTVGQEEFEEAETNAAEDSSGEKDGSSRCCSTGCGFSPGAIYAGIESVLRKAKCLDSQMTGNAGLLASKVTGYFRRSIDAYKERSK